MGRSAARSNLPLPGGHVPSSPQAVVEGKNGERAEYAGGPLTSLTPVVEGNGVENQIVRSKNLDANAGGEPVAAIAEVVNGQAESPHVTRYVVTGEKPYSVSEGGIRFTLRPGKIITASSYNIPRIKSQGVKLRELAPGEEP